MAEKGKKEDKGKKPAEKRAVERPAWAAHDNPANPGRGPGGRRGAPFVQRIRKGNVRGR